LQKLPIENLALVSTWANTKELFKEKLLKSGKSGRYRFMKNRYFSVGAFLAGTCMC
jgi:hypothetical protein